MSIEETLSQIKAIDRSRVKLFASGTRDQQVPVFIDPVTEVIYIRNHYVGDREYEEGSYDHAPNPIQSFEDFSDSLRRASDFAPYYVGRSVLDFGCGSGGFLRQIAGTALKVQGVELTRSFREQLNNDGIACWADVFSCQEVDTVFMFHVLEHLPDPLTTLRQIRDEALAEGGNLVVEVPHARDFLLSHLQCKEFKDFTLWSQHLVLHTRASLRLLLLAAGFRQVAIYGIQRYGLANHLHWLASRKPGGHKGPLGQIESQALNDAYAAALSSLDATDSLIAIAQ